MNDSQFLNCRVSCCKTTQQTADFCPDSLLQVINLKNKLGTIKITSGHGRSAELHAIIRALQMTATEKKNDILILFLLTKMSSISYLIICTMSCTLCLDRAMPSTLRPPLRARRRAGGATEYFWDLKKRDGHRGVGHTPNVLHTELESSWRHVPSLETFKTRLG